MLFKKNKKEIYIEGMHCEHCAEKVEDVLLSIDGISKVKVNLNKKVAIISYSKDIDRKTIEDKIKSIDFKVINIK